MLPLASPNPARGNTLGCSCSGIAARPLVVVELRLVAAHVLGLPETPLAPEPLRRLKRALRAYGRVVQHLRHMQSVLCVRYGVCVFSRGGAFAASSRHAQRACARPPPCARIHALRRSSF